MYSTGTVNNIAGVSIESSTDSKTTIKLQWQERVTLLLNQIIVLCSTESSHDELFMCNQTVAIGNEVVVIEIQGLNPSTTYYYKVEVAGDKPFVLLGVFSTTGKYCYSIFTCTYILRNCTICHFCCMSLLWYIHFPAADNTPEKGSSISLEIRVAGICKPDNATLRVLLFRHTLVLLAVPSIGGGIMLGAITTTFICFCLVCRVWKSKKV